MTRSGRPGRVGFYGNLCSGNLGNDASLDSVVCYLRAQHPDLRYDFFCMGSEAAAKRYAAPATPMLWNRPERPGHGSLVLKMIGMLVDPFRLLAWVRRQDVVIVPGMGVLESTIPMRPWGFPSMLCTLAVVCRLTGRKLILPCVGADVIGRRFTRALLVRAARLASYRSYRDQISRRAMSAMGVDVTADEVYCDLAFALPAPEAAAASPGTVGVGVMNYWGSNDERPDGARLHRVYLDEITRFVRGLVDDGRRVRLFVGDCADLAIVDEILRRLGPRSAPSVQAVRTDTLSDLMSEMGAVDAIVASRYHNVLAALKMSKPTFSLSYAAKNDALMDAMGLAGCHGPASGVDADSLRLGFDRVSSRSAELRGILLERNRIQRCTVEEQFRVLSVELFGSAAGEPAAGAPATVRTP